MSKLTLMIGPSASGKSTRAKGMVNAALRNKQKMVRVNRDSLREMMLCGAPWNYTQESAIKAAEVQIVRRALQDGWDVIVDDTNLAHGTVLNWKSVAQQEKAEFDSITLNVDLKTCLARDVMREGKARVGRAVIERQFLYAGLQKFGDKKLVIVDVDGTLANHEGIRSPYDESLVHMDKPYEFVCKWVRYLVHADGCMHCGLSPEAHARFQEAKTMGYGTDRTCENYECPEYSVIIVSGRHDTCGTSTENWLNANGIPFDHLFMRAGGDNRPDTVIKQEILNGILKHVPKEQIAFVIDDRPKVIQMWRDNGLRVIPARGAVEDF